MSLSLQEVRLHWGLIVRSLPGEAAISQERETISRTVKMSRKGLCCKGDEAG